MDPWSKVDYSWLIREVSMAMEKLPEGIPPSGGVPGRGLLMLPILEALRRRNRGEIAKKGSVLEGFGTRGIYRRRGAARGPPGSRGAPLARPRGGRAPWPPRHQVAPPGPLRASGSFLHADFLYIFPGIFGALLIGVKPGTKRQQKTITGTVVH